MHFLGGWSEVSFAEGPAGTGLQVAFEPVGFVVVVEPDCDCEFPGAVFGCVWGFACVLPEVPFGESVTGTLF